MIRHDKIFCHKKF